MPKEFGYVRSPSSNRFYSSTDQLSEEFNYYYSEDADVSLFDYLCSVSFDWSEGEICGVWDYYGFEVIFVSVFFVDEISFIYYYYYYLVCYSFYLVYGYYYYCFYESLDYKLYAYKGMCWNGINPVAPFIFTFGTFCDDP